MLNNIINNKKKIFVCNKAILKRLKVKAIDSNNKRSRVCIHLSRSSQVQEMIIHALKDSYMPPHKHPSGNSETYHVISGKLDLYLFNTKGKIVKKISLEEYNKKKNSQFYYKPIRVIFGICQLLKVKNVFYEIYSGPWKRIRCKISKMGS